MSLIMAASGIVASYHTGNPTDTAVNDIIIQSVVGSAESTAQMILNGLNTNPAIWEAF